MTSSLRSLLPAAAVLSLFGILSRILGVVRDRLLTSTFGRSIETDAFLASNRIPDLIYQLLIVGAVSSVLIPAYTSARERGPDEAKRFAGNVMTLVLGALALTSLVAFLFATPLARVLTAGFDAQGIELTATLMRIQLVAPILLGASSICAALLQTHGTFWTFAIAPVLYNIGQIIGISVLSHTYGIEGAAWGVGIGALLHLLIQLPSTLRVHPVLTPHAPLHDHAVRTMLRQALPRVLALAGSQVNLLVETMLASLRNAVGLGTGAAQDSNGSGKETAMPICGPSLRSEQEVAAAAKPRCGGGTVLIVDDDEMVRISAQVTFELAGFSTMTAGDGEEAIGKYREHQERIVCVFLDLTLPQMCGEEVLHELRKINDEVRVILASGCDERELAQRFAGHGVWEFFYKSQPLDDLIARLHEALVDADHPS